MFLTKLGGSQILILTTKAMLFLKKRYSSSVWNEKKCTYTFFKILMKIITIEFNSCMWKQVVFVFWEVHDRWTKKREVHDPVRFYQPNTL